MYVVIHELYQKIKFCKLLSILRIPIETAWSKFPPLVDDQYKCAGFNILQKIYSQGKIN